MDDLKKLAAIAPKKMSAIVEAVVVEGPAGSQCAESGLDLSGATAVRVRFNVGACFYSEAAFRRMISPAVGGPVAPARPSQPSTPRPAGTGTKFEPPFRNRQPPVPAKREAQLVRFAPNPVRSGKTGQPI